MNMEHHPLANVFPMMTDEELADLAADIKANGLIHPIVVDEAGRLVDGRNRQRACEIAGVEPQYEQLNGRDAAAFIVSANLERRNLSKGQQAMAMAMIYPEAAKGGRGKTVQKPESFGRQRLSDARAVLRHSRALAEDVLADRKKLDDVLKIVEEHRRESASTDARMAELRRYAPEVAAMVADERLTLEAGLAELRERQRRIRQCIDDATRSVTWLKSIATHVTVSLTATGLANEELALLGGDGVDVFRDLSISEIDEMLEAITKLRKCKMTEVS